MNEAPRLADMLIEELKILSQIAEVHGNARRDAATVTSEDEPLESWGPLTVLERVGRGSYGEVYRAWDPRLDREVALKLLRHRVETDESPIIEEGRLLARVRHPNAITVHGADCIDGRVGIWMEFIEGRTLEEELQARGARPAAEVAAIGIDICRALDAVHKAGVVHADVKAQNVMRDSSGRIVLMDFGSGVSDRSDETVIGGTPLCLAPEVLAGGAPTIRSDVYAVGVLLYHLLTGGYPIEARTLAEVRSLHQSSRRTPLREVRPDVPRRLSEAIERGLNPDPQQRYDSAGAFVTAIEAATRAPRWRTAAVAAALMAIALAAFAWQRQIADSTAASNPERPAARLIWAIGSFTPDPSESAPSLDGRYLGFTDWETGDLPRRPRSLRTVDSSPPAGSTTHPAATSCACCRLPAGMLRVFCTRARTRLMLLLLHGLRMACRSSSGARCRTGRIRLSSSRRTTVRSGC